MPLQQIALLRPRFPEDDRLPTARSQPSVMAGERELESLTALDREALCRLYGSEPYGM